MYLFIDTETTGLPKKKQDAEIESGIWPDIVSIAWILTKDDGMILSTFYAIILPEYWTIPKDSTCVHGITNEDALEHGVPLKNVLDNLVPFLESTRVQVIAHNIHFDKNVIINALKWRLNKSTDNLFKNTFCTMESGRNITRLPGIGRDKYRCPKLSFLYKQLFGKEPELDLHNALHDTIICMNIYFKLKTLQSEPVIYSSKDAVPQVSSKKLSICLASAEE